MARKKQLTPEQVIAALEKHHGIQASAARALNVSRTTIYNYIKDNEEIQAAYEQINEAAIDFVEGELMKNIKKGNVTAQIFFLKTKAKHRGYVERTEWAGTGEGRAFEHVIKRIGVDMDKQ